MDVYSNWLLPNMSCICGNFLQKIIIERGAMISDFDTHFKLATQEGGNPAENGLSRWCIRKTYI